MATTSRAGRRLRPATGCFRRIKRSLGSAATAHKHVESAERQAAPSNETIAELAIPPVLRVDMATQTGYLLLQIRALVERSRSAYFEGEAVSGHWTV
jgi:hypothetical protein